MEFIEIWKDVIGYECLYEVSETGKVRTKEGKVTINNRGNKRKWKQRILKQKISKDNTCRVSLWKDGNEKTWLVHRLVAFAFIPTIEGKEFINHIDGNRLNNKVDNLEWCNHKENNNHAFDTGLMTSNISIILENKKTKELHYFRSMSKASEFIGRSHGYLSDVVKNKHKNTTDYEIYMKIS